MRALLALALAACSLVFVACDSSTTVAVNPSKVGMGITGTPSDLRLVVNSSSSAVNLNSFTVHLISGENVGGPMVTYPQASLTSTFGSTVIVGTRTFVFPPPFICSSLHPCKIQANAIFVDGSGLQQVRTATVTIP